MKKLTTDEIRQSFRNASRSEVKAITFPTDFDERDWDSLDYLGWRDPKIPQRGYLIYPGENGLSGLLLRAPETGGKARKVLCELCRDVRCEYPVTLYVTRRTGKSGRQGNTVGTLICTGFQCSANVRTDPPASQIPLDAEGFRRERISKLKERLAGFLQKVEAD